MKSILITGANGFVGRALSDLAISRGMRVRRSTRIPHDLHGSENMVVGEVDGQSDWTAALDGVEVVIHLAARTHVMTDTVKDPLAEFRRVNVDGTLNLAHQAIRAGVRRFIFISSIGVNGAETYGAPYTAEDKELPVSPYSISKHEAEIGLAEIREQTGLEVAIIRPPLVYGPNAKGNFKKLINAVYRGVPLPLGAIKNKRSFVALENLVDLIFTCMDHPNAVGHTFMVSDGEDMSTSELLQRTARAMGRPPRLVPIPAWALRTGAKIAGKPELAQRLCGSLQVDISQTRELLGWAPVIHVDEALKRTAEHFLAELARH